jgi:uroporphyrinogen-III synthase
MASAIAKHIRILTVGEATAAAARASGFNAVTCIGQTVEKAAHALAEDLSLAGASIVYLSGTHITHDVTVLMGQAGPSIVRVPVYATRQLALEKTTIQLLSEGGISWIVLFSRRTAEAFSMAVADLAMQDWIKATGLVCLSARTAEPLQTLPWRTVLIAPEPTSAALVESIPHG